MYSCRCHPNIFVQSNGHSDLPHLCAPKHFDAWYFLGSGSYFPGRVEVGGSLRKYRAKNARENATKHHGILIVPTCYGDATSPKTHRQTHCNKYTKNWMCESRARTRPNWWCNFVTVCDVQADNNNKQKNLSVFGSKYYSTDCKCYTSRIAHCFKCGRSMSSFFSCSWERNDWDKFHDHIFHDKKDNPFFFLFFTEDICFTWIYNNSCGIESRFQLISIFFMRFLKIGRQTYRLELALLSFGCLALFRMFLCRRSRNCVHKVPHIQLNPCICHSKFFWADIVFPHIRRLASTHSKLSFFPNYKFHCRH